MKYASEVIELMGAYPERKFVMRQIIRYINPQAGSMERVAIKKAVQRVMVALSAMGNVEVTKKRGIGGTAHYGWKTGTSGH